MKKTSFIYRNNLISLLMIYYFYLCFQRNQKRENERKDENLPNLVRYIYILVHEDKKYTIRLNPKILHTYILKSNCQKGKTKKIFENSKRTISKLSL